VSAAEGIDNVRILGQLQLRLGWGRFEALELADQAADLGGGISPVETKLSTELDELDRDGDDADESQSFGHLALLELGRGQDEAPGRSRPCGES